MWKEAVVAYNKVLYFTGLEGSKDAKNKGEPLKYTLVFSA